MGKAKAKATLKAALKADDRCRYVAEVDGVAWIGTSYWVAEVGYTAREMLAQYNIPLAAARFDVNGSITLTDETVPDLANIVALPDDSVELTEATYHGEPVIVSRDGLEARAYEHPDGTPVFVNRDFVAAICGEIGDIVAVRQVPGDAKPVHFVGATGRGLVMPVRTRSHVVKATTREHPEGVEIARV